MIDPYGGFLRTTVFPLGDHWRGIPIGRTLRFLEESQYWNRDRLDSYRTDKLRKLVDLSLKYVPYYRETLRAAGFAAGDISSLQDLARLPVLTRTALRGKPMEHFLNESADITRATRVRTGGSTGQALEFLVSNRCRAFDRATLYRLYRWCGLRRGDRLFSVWGDLAAVHDSGLARRARLLRKILLSRTRTLDAFNMSPEAQRLFFRRMRGPGRKILRGYTSALLELARFAGAGNFSVPRLEALVATAEPLYPEQRDLLASAFGAPVYDQYGCAEVNGVAMQCEQIDGLHISEEHVIVEILDDDDQPVEPGVPGRVVLTNLDNEVMPFIRYDNGDIGALREGSCTCGRTLALMEPVQGRQVDIITGPNGNAVYGTFFYHALARLGWFENLELSEFQVTQTATDRLEMALSCARFPDAVRQREMLDLVSSHLGTVFIEFQQVDALKRSRAGKLRYTIGLPGRESAVAVRTSSLCSS